MSVCTNISNFIQSTEDLDSVMQKKARIGFSRSEYERYLQLMRDNLVGFEETPQAARSDAPLRSKPPMIKKYRSSDYLPPVSGIVSLCIPVN